MPNREVSGVGLLKELGPIIAIPFVVGALLILLVGLRNYPFGIQIVVLFAYTGLVLLFVFCDTRSWKGYSLSEKPVRARLPLLLWIHAALLGVIFAGVTGAISLRPHLPDFWTIERGTRRPLSYFDLILLVAGSAILWAQILVFRGILGRALKDDGGSVS
jgi:hypothetical protein